MLVEEELDVERSYIRVQLESALIKELFRYRRADKHWVEGGEEYKVESVYSR